MKRIALTIILNGLHHLNHKNFFNKMLQQFDLWVIIEGVAKPGGSTSWCKDINEKFHKNFLSLDGTTEFLDANKNSKMVVVRPHNRPWISKDEQVNAGIAEIKKRHKKCFLWQVDVDEHWEEQQLKEAEEMLLEYKGKTGCFLCDYFVGKNQQVFGEWGECINDTWRRLWIWEGEEFAAHEPPTLIGKNGPGYLLPQRFIHYSYYFDKDVIFKERYYSGYDGLYERWKNIQDNKGIIPVIDLLGPNIRWSYTNTIIKYVGKDIL
jgi:hypothetical protein